MWRGTVRPGLKAKFIDLDLCCYQSGLWEFDQVKGTLELFSKVTVLSPYWANWIVFVESGVCGTSSKISEEVSHRPSSAYEHTNAHNTLNTFRLTRGQVIFITCTMAPHIWISISMITLHHSTVPLWWGTVRPKQKSIFIDLDLCQLTEWSAGIGTS